MIDPSKNFGTDWFHNYTTQTEHYSLQDWHIALEKRVGFYRDMRDFNERRNKFSKNAARRKNNIEDEYCMLMTGYIPNPPIHSWEDILSQISIDYDVEITEANPYSIKSLFKNITEQSPYPLVKIEEKSGTIIFKTPDGKFLAYKTRSKKNHGRDFNPFTSIDFRHIKQAITSLSLNKINKLDEFVKNIISSKIFMITKEDRQFIYGNDRENYLHLKKLTENNETIRPLSTQNFILHLSGYSKNVEKLLKEVPQKMYLEYAESLSSVRLTPYGDNSHVLPFNWLNETHQKTAWYEIDLTKSQNTIMHELSQNIRALRKFYYINDQRAQAPCAESFNTKAECANLHDLFILAYLDFKIFNFAFNARLKDDFFDEKLNGYTFRYHSNKPKMNSIKNKLETVMTNGYLNAMRAKVISEPCVGVNS